MFTYDDIVRVKMSAPAPTRPGARCWVVGVFPPEERARVHFPQFPPGVVYTVEFEDGVAIDIHEEQLEPDRLDGRFPPS